MLSSKSEVTFAWSHPQDITPETVFEAHYSDPDVFFDIPTRVEGTDVKLTFPEFTGSSDGTLTLHLQQSIGGDAASCEGATACQWIVESAYRHVATLR